MALPNRVRTQPRVEVLPRVSSMTSSSGGLIKWGKTVQPEHHFFVHTPSGGLGDYFKEKVSPSSSASSPKFRPCTDCTRAQLDDEAVQRPRAPSSGPRSGPQAVVSSSSYEAYEAPVSGADDDFDLPQENLFGIGALPAPRASELIR